MRRWIAGTLGLSFACVPFFPPFIFLTGVTVPGVSLLPRSAAVVLFIAMIVMAAWWCTLLLRAPRERPSMLVPLLLWLGAAVLAGLLGFDPAAGIVFDGIFGLCIIWHLMIMRFYRESGVAHAIYWTYLVSGTISALAALVMIALRHPANQYAIGHGRAIGTFILPGELAGYLIIFLPVAFAIARTTRDAALRATAYCALAIGGVAFVLTFSRAGWMGLAAAIACYAIFSGAIRRRYAPLILLAGLAAVLLAFNVHHNPAENYTRLSIWQAGIEIVRRFPLTGVGPFDFARIYPLVRLPDGDAQAFHAHSFLLTIFAETGIVGLTAALWAWWRFAVTLRERLRSARPANATLALAIAAGLAGTWVQGLIDVVSVVIFGLWLPVMALALAAATDGLGEE